MKQTPAFQDKPTLGGFEPSCAIDWLSLVCAFLASFVLTSAFVQASAGVADRAVGGEAARGAGGRAGAPLGNHGEINSVVTE